ncbi:hypothetical protein NPIL_409861 [Nephila pilipes]|uniref:Uncharacterized protein n=1 Tax=Nephila pilipes TaxID=299642 RepID=A0A8X6KH76_NEPPI|nr:hypothetical protein NPIL_409861 [Nephila pilipes]
MDVLKLKLDISEAVVVTASANRSIIDEEDGINLVSPSVMRSKYYNSQAKKPCHDNKYDMYEHFPCADDISMSHKCKFENCKNGIKTHYEKGKAYLCLSKTKSCFKDFHCT